MIPMLPINPIPSSNNVSTKPVIHIRCRAQLVDVNPFVFRVSLRDVAGTKHDRRNPNSGQPRGVSPKGDTNNLTRPDARCGPRLNPEPTTRHSHFSMGPPAPARHGLISISG